MEDFHVTLSLLELCFPNLVMQDFACGQAASNAPGGCSLYRDAKLQSQAAMNLAAAHPGFVKVVTKNAKSWQGMNTRTDVRVQWKKAFSTCTMPKNP